MIKPKRKYYIEDGPKAPKYLYNQQVGSKHPLPHNMTRNDYEQLRKLWDKKLREAGFADIEKINPKTGQADAAFKSSKLSHHGSAMEQIIVLRPDKVEYFRLCRCFLEHANFEELFGKNAWLYRTMFTLHCDGLAYRKIARYFRGDNVPSEYRKPKASEFWSHWHLQRILRQMWPWQRTHPEGLLLPEDAD